MLETRGHSGLGLFDLKWGFIAPFTSAILPRHYRRKDVSNLCADLSDRHQPTHWPTPSISDDTAGSFPKWSKFSEELQDTHTPRVNKTSVLCLIWGNLTPCGGTINLSLYWIRPEILDAIQLNSEQIENSMGSLRFRKYHETVRGIWVSSFRNSKAYSFPQNLWPMTGNPRHSMSCSRDLWWKGWRAVCKFLRRQFKKMGGPYEMMKIENISLFSLDMPVRDNCYVNT